MPFLDFIEMPDNVRPGDRVVTSGDGGVFPPGLLAGQAVQGSDGRIRLRLAADIVDRGVILTGGGAMLGDLDLALREQTGL